MESTVQKALATTSLHFKEMRSLILQYDDRRDCASAQLYIEYTNRNFTGMAAIVDLTRFPFRDFPDVPLPYICQARDFFEFSVVSPYDLTPLNMGIVFEIQLELRDPYSVFTTQSLSTKSLFIVWTQRQSFLIGHFLEYTKYVATLHRSQTQKRILFSPGMCVPSRDFARRTLCQRLFVWVKF